jgi:hypothetical protein
VRDGFGRRREFLDRLENVILEISDFDFLLLLLLLLIVILKDLGTVELDFDQVRARFDNFREEERPRSKFSESRVCRFRSFDELLDLLDDLVTTFVLRLAVDDLERSQVVFGNEFEILRNEERFDVLGVFREEVAVEVEEGFQAPFSEVGRLGRPRKMRNVQKGRGEERD